MLAIIQFEIFFLPVYLKARDLNVFGYVCVCVCESMDFNVRNLRWLLAYTQLRNCIRSFIWVWNVACNSTARSKNVGSVWEERAEGGHCNLRERTQQKICGWTSNLYSPPDNIKYQGQKSVVDFQHSVETVLSRRAGCVWMAYCV